MIVYTGGTFDVLHAGHIDFLAICRQVAGPEGKVYVGLNKDEFVSRYKQKSPVCTYEERARVLQACRYVDYVIDNEGNEDSKPVILKVDPDCILIGEDWANRGGAYYTQMQFTPEWLAEHSIVLLYVPRTRILSSTAIKERAHEQLRFGSVDSGPVSA